MKLGWTPCKHYDNCVGWCPHCLLEAAYLAARGQEGNTDRFAKLGANQMYWKGRSDAAQAVRELEKNNGGLDTEKSRG